MGAQPSLPPDVVTFRAFNGEARSFLGATFLNVPTGYAVSNASYYGWCVEFDKLILEGVEYPSRLYDWMSTNLPAHLATSSWDRVAYVINHKQGEVRDIQNAVWMILDQPFTPPISTETMAMVEEAEMFGSGFVPTNGQTGIVIVDPVDTEVQRIVIETNSGSECSDPTQPSEIMMAIASYMQGGPFMGRILGQIGECYQIEMSADLINWIPLTTLMNTTGIVEFTDPDAPPGSRYYRARLQ